MLKKKKKNNEQKLAPTEKPKDATHLYGSNLSVTS